MTDKELQKLSKTQLIELLYYLSKENDELKEENQKLKDRLDALLEKALATMQETGAEHTDKEE